MKKQIKYLSPHQNGKVFGVLLAISSLIIFVPMGVMMYLMPPITDHDGNPVVFPPLWIIFIFPFLYLITGYIMGMLMCVVYNFVSKFIGGIEYE